MSVTISTKDLVKKYGSRVVVNHVSFEVKQGEIVGLLGPNGAGKTTSFYQVVGLVKPDEGHVFLNDQDITALPMFKRAQMGIGYLPQEASIFRKLSVEDNISAILEMTKLSRAEQKAKLNALLKEFRLEHVRKSHGDVLSGGERRRTEIARALSVDPKFILLDEPFAGIDPIAVEDIQSIVAKLKHKNIGILITDHNVTETLSICDRAYLLIEGKIFKHGTAEELAADEQVRKLYLGRNFELRRKDYLHEEARGEVGTTSAHESIVKLEYTVEKCVIETERKLAMFEKVGFWRFRFMLAADLGLPEYFRYVEEIKSALKIQTIDASKGNNAEIQQLILQMPELKIENYKSLKTYDTLLGLSFFGWIPLWAASLIYYRPLIKKLQQKLIDLKNILSSIDLLLKTGEDAA